MARALGMTAVKRRAGNGNDDPDRPHAGREMTAILTTGFVAVMVFSGVAFGPFVTTDAFGDEISARALRAAFKSNNLRAETQYSGRTYDVTGLFEGAENGLFHTGVVVTMAGDNVFETGFLGTLADGESGQAMRLNKGDGIRLRCILKDTTLGTPTGYDCRFVSAAAPIVSQAMPQTSPMPVYPPIRPATATHAAGLGPRGGVGVADRISVRRLRY